MERLRQIAARLLEIESELRGIHTEAGENRLTDDQQTRWDPLYQERSSLLNEQTALNTQLEQRRSIATAAATSGSTEPGDGATGLQVMRRVEAFDGASVRNMPIPEARDKALKALEMRGKFELNTQQIDDLDRQINRDTDIARRLLVTESEDYRAAWKKLVTRSNPVLSREETEAVLRYEEYRAMSEGTNSAGGYGIPVLIDPTIILTAQGLINPFMNLADVKNITTNKWAGVNSAGVTWAFAAEAATASDNSPTLAQPSATVYRAQGFIPFSVEIDQDYPDFAAEMSELLAVGYDDLLIQKFSVGSGTGEPNGIVTVLDADTNVEVIVTTSGAFGAVDMYKVWEQVPQRFRHNASWMMSVLTNDKIRQFGTTLGQAYTQNLQEGVSVGQFGNIMGKPVYESPYFPDFTGSTGSVNILVVGDFKNYVIVKRAGMNVELVPLLQNGTGQRPTGQRGWYAWARIGGDVKTTRAFRLLVNAT